MTNALIEHRNDLGDLRDRRVLLVASTGGHLAQLFQLRERLGIRSDSPWVTFESDQSRSLLQDHDVTYVPYIASRDWKAATRTVTAARQVFRNFDGDTVLSTGAALALSFLPYAALTGRRSIYIESVSRFDGPSLTGAILRRAPRVETYTQHAGWAGRNWPRTISVLDSYRVEPKALPGRGLKVFVTLGTISPYRFDALIDRVVSALPDGTEVRWQLGVTERSGLPGKVSSFVTDAEFAESIDWADVVISHAGVGSALKSLDLGKCPILVPRRASRREHVDDHQMQIARELAQAGFAEYVEVNQLTTSTLGAAAGRRIRRAS